MRALLACPARLFQLRLADRLGIPNVDMLADSLTEKQTQEWKALSIIDGWHSGWTQTAELIAAIQNQTNNLIISNSAKPKQTMRSMKWASGFEIVKELNQFERKQKPQDPVDIAKVLAAAEQAKTK